MTEAGNMAWELPAVRAIGPDVGLAGKVFAGHNVPGIGRCRGGADGRHEVGNLRILAADSAFGAGFRPFKDGEQGPIYQAQNTKKRGADKSKEDGHGRRKEHEQALNASQEGFARMRVLSRL